MSHRIERGLQPDFMPISFSFLFRLEHRGLAL
ncbi:unnamed protein product [Cuscuta epithymum]|uniref:Uncharacterized protein n=1 Tax=Cuscuta epithymum TaxID=186058 RepID=A0AAV0D245_9ASTE|nr:unnamed protein product [Cuscuta epithymum]